MEADLSLYVEVGYSTYDTLNPVEIKYDLNNMMIDGDVMAHIYINNLNSPTYIRRLKGTDSITIIGDESKNLSQMILRLRDNNYRNKFFRMDKI